MRPCKKSNELLAMIFAAVDRECGQIASASSLKNPQVWERPWWPAGEANWYFDCTGDVKAAEAAHNAAAYLQAKFDLDSE